MAEIRADPVLKSILFYTFDLIDEEKERENLDFHSDDEDEKCIDLSTDSQKNLKNTAQPPENLMNHCWQKKSLGSV
jgi:hypothetical protein